MIAPSRFTARGLFTGLLPLLFFLPFIPVHSAEGAVRTPYDDLIRRAAARGSKKGKRVRRPQPRPRPARSVEQKEEESFWAKFVRKSDLSYYGRFNGPALMGEFKKTYNVYLRGPGPITFYHSVSYRYRPDELHYISLGISGLQGLVTGVTDEYGNEFERKFTIFHPRLTVGSSSILKSGWLDTSGELYAEFPTSEFAQDQSQIITVGSNLGWGIDLGHPDWSFSLSTTLQFSIYQNRLPQYDGDLRRQTFYMSAGHYIGYRISRYFTFSNSSLFDADHYAGDTTAFLDLETANDDRTEFKLTFGAGPFSLGTYWQFPLFESRFEKSTVGLDLSLTLL